MLKDECLVLDEADNIVGHSNKYECHRFLQHQPNGILHRAFSVVLFNEEGKLLLQQRAKSKVCGGVRCDAALRATRASCPRAHLLRRAQGLHACACSAVYPWWMM